MTLIRRAARLLGAAIALALPLSCIMADAQSFRSLHSFQGGADGASPLGNLIQGQDGNLYGTTIDNSVFRIGLDGSGYAAYSLLTVPGCGGPWSGVTQGSDGSLYGASISGGMFGYGGIWKIQPDGSELTLLHSFAGFDGDLPHSAPIAPGDGFIYGATMAGGPLWIAGVAYGDGVVYKIAEDGSSFTILHEFDYSDGDSGISQLTLGQDGYLYGTTQSGGSGPSIGTIYKISRDGSVFQTVYTPDDYDLVFGVIQAPNGTLYGTIDGSSDGTVGLDLFSVQPDGTGYTVLASFGPYNTNNPIAGIADQFPRVTVAIGQDGYLYGSSVAGGPSGILYRIKPDGTGLTTLYSFSQYSATNTNTDGAFPLEVIVASNGKLYGTTLGGGTYGLGTIFELDPHPTPPVTSIALAGPAGTNGWFVGPVSVTLTATDAAGPSTQITTEYSLDGGPLTPYASSFTVIGDAIHTLVYYSVDQFGNSESPHSQTIEIDSTAPVITYSGDTGTYTVDETVNITATVTDNLSGVVSTTAKPISGPAYTFNIGANLISATATDAAGNVGTGSTHFNVVVTYTGLINLTNRFVTNAPIADLLDRTLESAKDASSHGNRLLKDLLIDLYQVEAELAADLKLTTEADEEILERLSEDL